MQALSSRSGMQDPVLDLVDLTGCVLPALTGRQLQGISKSIRSACHTDKFFQILYKYDCGACDGGCLMVAIALSHVLQKSELQLASIYGSMKTSDRVTHQHILLRKGRLYVDGDGVSNFANLEYRWTQIEGLKRYFQIKDVDGRQILQESQIPYDIPVTRNLVMYFYQKLRT